MNRTIRFRTFLIGTIFLSAITAILVVFSGKVFYQRTQTQTPDQLVTSSEVIRADHSIMQEFFPEQENLVAINVMIDSLGQSTGLFYFNLYDQNLNQLFHTAQRLRIEGENSQLYYRFPVDQNLISGQPYYFTLEYKDASLSACFADSEQAMENHNGKTYFALVEQPEYQVITSYEYREKLSTIQSMIVYLVILVVSGILIAAISLYPGFSKRKKKFPIVTLILVYLTEILLLVTGYSVYQIGMKKAFTYEQKDNIVLMLGVTLIAGCVMYGIWKMKEVTIPETRQLKMQILPIIQIILVAQAILSCIEFVNAGSNYAQGLALMEMCSWFGAFMLAMSLIEIIKSRFQLVFSIIYCIATMIYGYYHLLSFWGKGEPFETELRTVIMLGIWILLVLKTLLDLVTKRPRFSWQNLGLVATFFVCLLFFRTTSIWVVATVVPFTVFILKVAMYRENEKILQVLSNGVILSFLIVLVQSLLHRPFHYYIYIRYAGVFTTVTVTSVYLGLVFAVGVVKLFGKLQKSTSISSAWKEWVFLGLVSGYQCLTLSRTGILTCAGIFMVALILHWVSFAGIRFDKSTIKKMSIIAVMGAFVVLAGFVCAFTLTRTVPALVNDPFIYEIEEFQDSIHKGEPINAGRYITIDRFLGLSAQRILGKTETVVAESVSVNQAQQVLSTESMEEVETEGTEVSDTTVSSGQIQDGSEVSSELSSTDSGYSNGRFEIFKHYLNNLNLEGHDAVGLTLEDGTTIIHSHNSFIQMAYDAGILTGFLFVVLYVILGVRTIKYYLCRYRLDKHALMPVLIFAAFGIASMVEYVFRPTIPLGFVFLAVMAPLLTDFEKVEKQIK